MRKTAGPSARIELHPDVNTIASVVDKDGTVVPSAFHPIVARDIHDSGESASDLPWGWGPSVGRVVQEDFTLTRIGTCLPLTTR